MMKMRSIGSGVRLVFLSIVSFKKKLSILWNFGSSCLRKYLFKWSSNLFKLGILMRLIVKSTS